MQSFNKIEGSINSDLNGLSSGVKEKFQLTSFNSVPFPNIRSAQNYSNLQKSEDKELYHKANTNDLLKSITKKDSKIIDLNLQNKDIPNY